MFPPSGFNKSAHYAVGSFSRGSRHIRLRFVGGGLVNHRRSRWLLSCTEAPPVPFRRVLPSLLAVPSLACSVASLSLCPGGYLPDQHPLQSTGLAGCQIAWDTSSTWSGKHAQELQLLHLLVLSDRCQLNFTDFCIPVLRTSTTCPRFPLRPTRLTAHPCKLPDCMGHAMRLLNIQATIATLRAAGPNERIVPTSRRRSCKEAQADQFRVPAPWDAHPCA